MNKKTSLIKRKACIIILIAMLACGVGLVSNAWAEWNGGHKETGGASYLKMASNGPGSCVCRYDHDLEKCIIYKSKDNCNEGFKPKCEDYGDGDCGCKCVQK